MSSGSGQADIGGWPAAVEVRRLPDWAVALALFFWGWQSQLLLLALACGLALLAPRVMPRRFELRRVDFRRALDVCWVLFFGALLWVYSQETLGNVLRHFLQWLPALFVPALLAQVWSTQGTTPLEAVLPLPVWRRQHANSATTLDLTPAFVAMTILSGSVEGGNRQQFYPALVVVAGSLLWSVRSRATAPWAAALLLAVSVAGGWGVGRGLSRMQEWVETRVLQWAANVRRENLHARSSHTSIGQTGDKHGSSRVVLRIRHEGRGAVPAHLQMASFTVWRGDTWFAHSTKFEKVSEAAAEEWPLDSRGQRIGAVHVELARDRTANLLPLPLGTRVIGELPAQSVERTLMGSVRAEINANVIAYRADYARDAQWEAEPSEEDASQIPSVELPAVASIAAQLQLVGQPPQEVLDRLDKFFSNEFRYTLALADPPATNRLAETPLGRFLLGHRTGHCEYFATAAALLLRQAGVPARYATGYLVDPTSRLDQTYTVRESTAHAWVRVWIDGKWQDFDPTPSGSVFAEFAELAWGDRWQRAAWDSWFGLVRWWWLGEKQLLRHAYWLAVPLLAGLLWRFRQLRSATPTSTDRAAASAMTRAWPGLDSEWLAVEAELAARGWSRQRLERLAAWQARLQTEGWESPRLATLTLAHQLHTRLRFDPRGLDAASRGRLRELAAGLANELSRRPPPPAAAS